MKNQVLTIEQMQTLKELGVDTSKASMYYVPKLHSETEYLLISIKPHPIIEYIPAFTLEDILEILPTTIVAGTWSYDLTSDLKNHIAYLLNDELFSDEDEFLHTETGENLLDIAYRMLVWVIQNGYLKTNK